MVQILQLRNGQSTYLLEILQCACFVVDTPGGRIVS
jgi:hypothetical protein